ncbi:ribonuclease HIII [Erysipelothrix larvae]|uniref:Ribonuclease HIII n=1 Tax=Erysipelothrix larvae TaxID=1514105 RepID=A0A109UHS7_9FIRM|nr:ribonuclease HIII [Erysipelothrix larvae]AMC94653.1 ribonuclease HIII [Erysipelothrix larvae]
METKSLTLTQKQIDDLKVRHKDASFRYDIAHTQFQLKGSDYTITVYTSCKVVFQGENLDLILSPYAPTSSSKPSTKPLTPHLPMAGSDEVGTGDYFGPVTVCACIVTQENANHLPLDLILDSKLMKDDVIMNIAPQLMDVLDYSLLILDNKTYNDTHKIYNLNQIKARLHNQAYLHLSKKAPMPPLAVVDQFMPKDAYYKALKGIDAYTPLHFETKAEQKYLAVACASIIARYAFLHAIEKMGTHYDCTFPKGAGAHVDVFGQQFVKRFGEHVLYDVAKTHFKNTQRIIGS